jgi:SCY1-like protein 1
VCCILTQRRLIRDQANKTLDLYLQRIRKYGQTLPDSVLPPPEAAGSNAPRMSTPQPGAGSGWAGWAISSFTNKLATASGEIQPNSSAATAPTASSDRSSSTPPANPSSSAAESLSAGRTRPTPTYSPSAPTVPRVSSGLRNATPAMSDVDQEDFGDDWGAMDDGDGAADAWGEIADDGAADAWGEIADSAPPAVPTKASTAAFDDGGEPDFEGWLNAQAQAKTKAKNPLPKGLAKSKPVSAAASNPSVVRSASSSVTTKAKPVAKPAPSKPVKPAAKEEDEEDWGSAW